MEADGKKLKVGVVGLGKMGLLHIFLYFLKLFDVMLL